MCGGGVGVVVFHVRDNPPGSSFGCAALRTAGRSEGLRGKLGLCWSCGSEVEAALGH